MEEQVLEPIDIAREAVEAASDKQAENIVLLDTREICSFADYFVICSGESNRQIDAIQEEIEKTLKKVNVPAHHVEGNPDSGWVLLDYSAVIVHIFTPEQRDYYALDSLWSKGAPVITIQ